MRRRVWLVPVSLLALGLSLPSTPAVAAAQVPAEAKVRGFGITTSNGGSRVVNLESGRMAAAGANTVSLEATWDVTSRDDNSIERSPGTVSDEALRTAALSADRADLSVLITVKVQCSGCRDSWRGLLEPSDREAFFRSYREMTNQYAALSESILNARGERVVDAFYVGSEMNSTQNETDEWIEVINQARARYSGAIGYQVNWDAMNEVAFWAFVDIAGISMYVPLSDALQPNVADLLSAWRSSQAAAWKGVDWASQIAAWADRHGKPVLFGEMGYQSAQQAAQRPWQEEKVDAWDAQLQADLYQAALTTFESRGWFLGVIWWEWKISSADEKDLSFSPRGKMAEELLTRWYDGERPATPQTSLVGVTRPSSEGKPAPTDTEGPTSPGGRTTLSAPVPVRASPRPSAAVPSAPGASSRGDLAAAPSLPDAPPSASAAAADVAAPSAAPIDPTTASSPRTGLGAVPVISLSESLRLTEERRTLLRGVRAASLLAAALVLSHAVLWGRRYGPALYRRLPRTVR